MNSKKLIGERVRALRRANNLTQKQVAQVLNISYSAIGKIELGHNSLDMEKASKLARLFKVTVDELIGKQADTAYLNEAPLAYNPNAGKPVRLVIEVDSENLNDKKATRFLQLLQEAIKEINE